MTQHTLEKQPVVTAPMAPSESNYIKIPIPSVKILKYFSDSKYVPLYVLVLMIMAFLLGTLTTKTQLLAAQGKTNGIGSAPAPIAQQAAAQAQPNQPQAPAPGQKVDVAVGHLPIKGNPNAKVTLIAFEDWRCPFCKKFFDETEPKIIKDYVDTGKAKLYYRHYQFLGPASTVAGNASECANEQGKFWDFHDYMYKNQPSESDTSMYTTDNLTSVAGNLGMNSDQFKQCLSANKFDKNVSGDLTDGQKAGVSGTPTVFIDGIPVVGAQPYTAFQTVIDQELKK